MTKKNVRKIKNFLINPRFQFKYALIVIAVGVGFAVANAFAFREFVQVNYEVLTQSHAVAEETAQVYVEELRRFTTTLLVMSAAFVALLAVWALLVTHRTAGPMFHFKRVFDAIRGGAPDQRVRLRPHDDFQDVADAFNRMMDQLTRRNQGQEP